MKLKLLTKDLTIPKTDGKETIAKAKEVFSYIDSEFEDWTLDNKQPATKEIKVTVLELLENATFKGIFTDPNSQVLTQNQILEFIKNHKNQLRQDGYATFFLFKENDQLFVASLRVDGGELRVYVYQLEGDHVWFGEFRHRVVVPQQTLESLESLTLSTSDHNPDIEIVESIVTKIKYKGRTYKLEE